MQCDIETPAIDRLATGSPRSRVEDCSDRPAQHDLLKQPDQARAASEAASTSETRGQHSSTEPARPTDRGAPADRDGSNSADDGSKPTAEASGRRTSTQRHIPAGIILNLECEGEASTKCIIRLLKAVTVAATVALAVQIYLKLRRNESAWFKQRRFAILNVAAAATCLGALLLALAVFLWRIWLVRGCHWSKRRSRLAGLYLSQLVVQIVNATFWLVPNAALLQSVCFLYGRLVDWSGLVRWTMWNSLCFLLATMRYCTTPLDAVAFHGIKHSDAGEDTDTIGGSGQLVLDASWFLHWPQAFIWVVMEAMLLWQHFDNHNSETDCSVYMESCYNDPQDMLLVVQTALLAVCIGLYSLLIVWYSLLSFNVLRRAPYSVYRVGNVIARLQARTTFVCIVWMFVATAALWFSQQQLCSNYLQTWFGLLPTQVVAAGLAAASIFFFGPQPADGPGPLLNAIRQQVAWTEVSRVRILEQRRSLAADHDGIMSEPLFCFETALKVYYWAFLSYRFEERPGADAEVAGSDHADALQGALSTAVVPRVDNALQLFDLTGVQLFREATHDTKMLLGHGPTAIVLAFRGTASRAGALIDLQAWQARHPIGSKGRSPWPSMVHRGFLAAWTACGFRDRVLQRVQTLLQQGAVPAAEMRVIVTGHSLGGALATLGAYDVAVRCGVSKIECITLGAPRVGNSAFVEAYNRVVPHTFHLINDQDTVTRAAKFSKLYRRTGHRAIITDAGDIIVRPLPLEQRLQLLLPGGNPNHHFLAAYGKSMMAIIEAQFASKQVPGGCEGIVALVEGSPAVRALLRSGGFVLDEVMQRAAEVKGEAEGHTSSGCLQMYCLCGGCGGGCRGHSAEADWP